MQPEPTRLAFTQNSLGTHGPDKNELPNTNEQPGSHKYKHPHNSPNVERAYGVLLRNPTNPLAFQLQCHLLCSCRTSACSSGRMNYPRRAIPTSLPRTSVQPHTGFFQPESEHPWRLKTGPRRSVGAKKWISSLVHEKLAYKCVDTLIDIGYSAQYVMSRNHWQ